MDMGNWVKHTQAASWGTGFKSGYSGWARSLESMHGNAALSARLAHLYRLEDIEGNFLKWGITQNLNSRYAASFLLDKRLVEVMSGTRAEMLELERYLVETRPGPWNLEPWAGAAR
jgi:hypothetical protein